MCCCRFFFAFIFFLHSIESAFVDVVFCSSVRSFIFVCCRILAFAHSNTQFDNMHIHKCTKHGHEQHHIAQIVVFEQVVYFTILRVRTAYVCVRVSTHASEPKSCFILQNVVSFALFLGAYVCECVHGSKLNSLNNVFASLQFCLCAPNVTHYTRTHLHTPKYIASETKQL